jgi:hypothetical protein
MKRLTVLLLLTVGVMSTSCTSEYEERLIEGRYLIDRLATVERSHNLMMNSRLSSEIEEIRNEINLLAKVSGNEELFLREVFED